MNIERARNERERHRVELEWITARADKAALQQEVNKARRAGREDAALNPTAELMGRLKLAKDRCVALQNSILHMLELERQRHVGRP